jgi:UTP--glucose-1-phosphate uridylyltransferase
MISNNSHIKKAVITAAGYGTRFLPATKNQPKEMLPVVDKPIIQYAVEEAVESGIEDIIIVTRFGQSSLENHFDSNLELEHMLEANGKIELLEKVRKVSMMANVIYVRQKKYFPYGNGTPLLTVKDLINKNERFIYMFGDDMVLSKTPCSKQIIDYSNKRDKAVVAAVQEVKQEEVKKYGIYKLAEGSEDRVLDAVEKPDPDKAPSRLAQFGRFVLNHDIIDILQDNFENKHFGKDGELWLTDAMVQYAKDNPVYVAKVEGEWMTTGDPLQYMKTQVKFALSRPDLGKDFAQFLSDLKIKDYLEE